MKLVVEAFDYNHALECIEQKIDVIVLGNDNFATRNSYSFNEQEIVNLINNKKSSEIWIKVNAFFFEPDIDRLICYLKWLASIDVDKVIFNDLAVSEISDEYQLNLKLHYNPETLITSYGQLPFYEEVGFDSVFLSRELTFNELEQISKKKNNLKLEIHGHGFSFMMDSRWKMIDNFIDYYDLKKNEINKDLLIIKEENRQYNDILFEDQHGTHMLTGYIVYTIDLIDKLKQLNIDYLKLDFIKTSNQYASQITKLYKLAIDNKLTTNDLNYFYNLNKNYVLTHNFLGGLNQILGLKKDEQHE